MFTHAPRPICSHTMKKPVKALLHLLRMACFEARKRYHLWRSATARPASVNWLVGTEIKYGGFVTDVPRSKVSPDDPRSPEEIQRNGMTGGDRMLHHCYAPIYAKYLRAFVEGERRVVLAEFGILRGTGLAIWCELFPSGRILGLDIDLDHTRANMSSLRRRGAFAVNEPKLHEFDQFLDNTEYLGTILDDDQIDICIDDGYHSIETILNTLRSAMPYLANEFVYFVEDNRSVHKDIATGYPEFAIEHDGSMTVLTRRATSSAGLEG